MSINIKKYTKEQMLKMLEEAAEKQEAAEAEAAAHFKDGVKLAEENEELRGEIGTLTEKLDATEAALGRANAELTYSVAEKNALRNDVTKMVGRAAFELGRADYAEAHPWRNLWEWVKRKMVRHE